MECGEKETLDTSNETINFEKTWKKLLPILCTCLANIKDVDDRKEMEREEGMGIRIV